MTDVPAAIPVITPVEASTVALAGVPLDQAPPEVVLAKVVVRPTQTVWVPVMVGVEGRALIVTLTACVFVHPFALVMVMVPV